MEEKKIRKKVNLLSFAESEIQLLEKMKKMKEKKKKYISNMFAKIFNEILNSDKLLEILDLNKDNKEFQDKLSNILKNEILKYSSTEIEKQEVGIKEQEIGIEEKNE